MSTELVLSKEDRSCRIFCGPLEGVLLSSRLYVGLVGHFALDLYITDSGVRNTAGIHHKKAPSRP